MIDLTKTLRVRELASGDILDHRIVEHDTGSDHDYPIIAEIDDGADYPIVRFSAQDGASRRGKYALENAPEPVVESEGDDADANSSGSIVLPVGVFKVMHARYGVGIVLKVRAHETKSAYVEFPGGTRKWVLDRKLSAAA